ncbi:MAG: dihydroorotate dehydrogenase [Thermoguttaceae bacterium]|nr:dihydroorotate dehydrogenase [Thermoguttaceae bacterium]
MTLSVKLGAITLSNPIMAASGTFGYAKDAARFIDVSRLGGIVPKTVTKNPRQGNKPPRTVETTAGLLNAIGLDNDGLDEFCEKKAPYLRTLGCPIFVSAAPGSPEECQEFGEKLSTLEGMTAVEMNISCPNVEHRNDWATPEYCAAMTKAMRKYLTLPLSVKLTPNVTSIVDLAKAAEAEGADMISAINTCYGLAIDWRKRKSRIGNGYAGYSGPAIKPIALRCVKQIADAVNIPIIGIGGIANAEDVFDFLVAGASAVQIGTANFYTPDVTVRIIEEMPKIMAQEGINDLSEIIGTLPKI